MKPQAPGPGQLLLLGALQAAGFVVGALLGREAGTTLGFDAFGPGGFDTRAMIGIALIGLGGGAGVQLARRWYVRRHGDIGRF